MTSHRIGSRAVPRLVRRLGEQDDVTLDALVAFVDLSGFTQLSEQLAAEGTSGTERLRGLISDTFEPLIAELHAVGADVIGFAGDAMTVLLDGDASEHSMRQMIATLARAAQPKPAGGSDDLAFRTKVGVARGPVRFRHATNGVRRIGWLAGDGLDRAVSAEGEADPDQIILHASATGVTPPANGWRFAPAEGPHVRLVARPQEPSGPAYGRDLEDAEETEVSDWEPFLPAPVVRSVLAGRTDFLDEHRLVTCVFMGFPTPDHDGEVLSRIQDLCQLYGGEILHCATGDKGASILVCVGAPEAGADRELRALTIALAAEDIAPGVRIGVASGMVFAGRLGSAERWEYTCIGDPVNVSARLMGAALPGSTLVETGTLEALPVGVRADAEQALDLKGKSETVWARRLRSFDGAHREALGADPENRIVGRQSELNDILGLLSSASENSRGGMQLIVGDAGTGKTRLLQAVAHAGAPIGFAVAARAADPFDRLQPFGLAKGILLALGVAPTSLDELQALLGSSASPFRVRLLATLFGLGVDTELTDDTELAGLLTEAIVELLMANMGDRMLLALEDLHWADDESLQVLAGLATALRQTSSVVCATCRIADRVTQTLGNASSVALGPLADDSVRTLAAELWELATKRAANEQLLDQLVERSAGSPLFVSQLVRLAVEAGTDPRAERLPDDLAAPASVSELVLARLERMAPAVRTTIDYAAVFGHRFTAPQLAAAFSSRHGPADFRKALDQLSDRAFLSEVAEDTYTFAHSTVRESIYNRLSFELRRQLHHLVIVHLEERPNNQPAALAELAHHAEFSADEPRQRRYFRLAADDARAEYANDTAIGWYSKLLALDDQPDPELRLTLGTLKGLAGQWAPAVDLLRTVAEEHDDDFEWEARVQLGEVLLRLGETEEATQQLELVEEEGPAPMADAALVALLVHATNTGDVVDARSTMERLAVLRGSSEGINSRYVVHWLEGDLVAAHALGTSLSDQAVASGDPILAAYTAADLAGISLELGDTSGCLEWMERAGQLANETGNRGLQVGLLVNRVEVLLSVDDIPGADRAARLALTEASSVGFVRMVAYVLNALGAIAAQRDDAAWASELAGRALVLASGIDDPSTVVESIATLAEAGLRSPRPATTNDDLRSILRALENLAPEAEMGQRQAVEVLQLWHRLALEEASAEQVTATLAGLELPEGGEARRLADHLAAVVAGDATPEAPAPDDLMVDEDDADAPPTVAELLVRVDAMSEMDDWHDRVTEIIGAAAQGQTL